MGAQWQGESSVAGQATYVIATRPKSACVPTKGTGKDGGQPNGDNQVAQVLVWVDKVTFLPLKTEVRNSAGVVLDRLEVTSVQAAQPVRAVSAIKGAERAEEPVMA